MSSAVLAPAPRPSLLDLTRQVSEREDDLIALLETEEGGIPAELEAEFKAELYKVATLVEMTKAEQVSKLNGYYRMIEFFDERKKNIAENKKVQAERLALRSKGAENNVKSLRGMLQYALELIAKPDTKTGKLKAKLECDLATFSLRENAPDIEIKDTVQVPPEFKAITFTLPMAAFLGLREYLELEAKDGSITAPDFLGMLQAALPKASVAVDERAIQQTIEAAVDEVKTAGGPSPEDIAAAIEEARASVAGCYLPEKGSVSLVIK